MATRALDAIARGAFTATPRLAVTEESWEAIIVFRRCLECDAHPEQLGATFRGDVTEMPDRSREVRPTFSVFRHPTDRRRTFLLSV